MTAHQAQSFSARSIFNAGALVFASSMALSIGGFIFHAIASRKLGVGDYGALYALISLYGIAVLPLGLFMPVLTKYAAEFGALHDDSHVRGLIEFIGRAFVVCGGVYIIASVLLALPLGQFLHVPGWEIPVVGVMCAVGTLSGAFRATAQGVHNYTAYGVSLATEGTAKVAALALFALVGLTVLHSTLAFLLGMAWGLAFCVLPLARRYRNVKASPITLDWKRIVATTAGAASLTLTVALMGVADVILVKHFFPANDAGLYSAASLCARMLLYFVGFVPAILIPQATHRHARGERTRQTLWTSALFVAGVSLIGVVFYRFFGYIVLHALVGRAFDAALPMLTPYAGAMGLLSLTNTLGSYALATHRLGFVVPLLISTIATFAVIAVVHPSLQIVTQELLLGNLVMLACLVIPLALQATRRVHA